MEKRKIGIIFLAVFSTFLGIGMVLFVVFSSPVVERNKDAIKQKNEETAVGAEKENAIPNGEIQESIKENNEYAVEAILAGFADTVFTYDTSKRMFYEGCEQYMTEEAYQQFVPLIDLNETEEEGYKPRTVVSSLVSMVYYERIISETEVEVMMDAVFTTAVSKENQTRQLMRLLLVKYEGNWKISRTEIIDSIEQ